MSLSKHLVFVGAGHAHLTAMAHCDEYIKRGHRVTVISLSSYHYYSGMGPGMLSGIYRPQDIRFNVRLLAERRGASFIVDAIVSVDARKRTLKLYSGKEVVYDVASFNIGSIVALGRLSIPGDNVFPVKPIVNLLKARNHLIRLVHDKTPDIIVIGGGPAGLEIAGNAWSLVNSLGKSASITVVPGQRLLNGFPDKAYQLGKVSLEERGIKVLDGITAYVIKDGSARLSTGRDLPFDACFVATGVMPPPIFRESGLPTGLSGGLLVNQYLQSIAHAELFCGGDCADFQERALDKVGIYAVRENPILLHNLLAALENKPMKVFRPQKRFLLICNLGDGNGLLLRGNIIWRSKLAMMLKDVIDRKFMRTFQLSGERNEVE